VRGRVAALTAATLLALVMPAAAALVHGTITSLVERRLTLRADDGRTVPVDLSQVAPAVRSALTVGERIMVSGDMTAGAPLAARYVDPDRADPTRGGRVPPKPGPDAASWERVHGVVSTVIGTTVRIRSDDSRTLTVDAARVDATTLTALGHGERVTVIGLRSADRRHFTAHYIEQEPRSASGFPRGGAGAATAGQQAAPGK
jgi:hypothetical protein